MDYTHEQCLDLSQGDISEVPDFFSSSQRGYSDDEVMLASSHPKKRAGRKKFKETRHPVYRGIRQRHGNRWVCELRTPNNNARLWLGTYATAEMAARAHDVAALALRGRTACLNFADSAWRLPAPASIDARDIRRAASEAAEAFRPQELEAISETSAGCNNTEVLTSQHHQSNKNNNQVSRGQHQHQLKINDQVLKTNGYYVDDEAVFNMPRLLANMAEGLLLPPPHSSLGSGFNWDDTEVYCNDTEIDCEVSLWAHSI